MKYNKLIRVVHLVRIRVIAKPAIMATFSTENASITVQMAILERSLIHSMGKGFLHIALVNFLQFN